MKIKSIQRRLTDDKIDLINEKGEKIGTTTSESAESFLRAISSKKSRTGKNKSELHCTNSSATKTKKIKADKTNTEGVQLIIDF